MQDTTALVFTPVKFSAHPRTVIDPKLFEKIAFLYQ